MIDPKGRELPPADQTLRGLLSGPLDMDKLDYLPRDARACSVPYGGVDTARLIDALELAETKEERRRERPDGETARGDTFSSPPSRRPAAVPPSPSSSAARASARCTR